MSQFKLFKRSSCPICNGIRKDCRENTHTQIIHCRADVISAPGYRFIKQDAWGFNMWRADSGQDSWNESEWFAHRQRIAAEREKRLLEEAKHYASLLDADERDRNIRQLHRQLGLSTKHRQQLRDRGLSDAQIDSGKFFSIEPWQEVSAINPRLAGVNLWGTKLIVNAPGIGCPVWDVLGQIIGFQIRFDDATENKYKWATSRTKKRPNGATSHLQNGELPISCCRPIELQAGGAGEVGGAGGAGEVGEVGEAGEAQNSIGLAEGFIKSYIAAQKLNCVVIGAAGGNFPASSQQLKQTFETLRAKPNTHTVTLYPDAGALTNPTIMQRYRLTAELVQQWGYEIRVAWWGQLTKDSPDIDELEDINAITILSWGEFLALAQQVEADKERLLRYQAECLRYEKQVTQGYPSLEELQGDPSLQQRDEKRKQQQERNQKRYRNWQLASAGEPNPEPSSVAYAAYQQQEEQQELEDKAVEAERERQRKQQHDQQVVAVQRQLNNLTYPVNIALNQKYLPHELIDQIPNSGIINLKARKGGGKSTLIKKLIARWKRQQRPVISITPRIALGREQAFKWDITWIDECGVVGNYALTNNLRTQEQALGLCWDSFWKITGRDWKGAVIIIDEAELGLSHLATSSTCEDRRAFILKGFERSIQQVLGTGGLVVLSDADLTDIPCNYIKAISQTGEHKNAHSPAIFTICNTHQGDAWDVEFYTGKRGDVVTRIKDNLELGTRTAVATDSQAEAEALERKLLQAYPHAKIVRIDSTVTESEFGREFVKDPNQGILDTQPDLLIYTPSMGVGVSIEVEWFDEVFGLFFGALEPSQCRQMLARIRLPIPRIIYCVDARYDLPGCKSFLPDVIRSQLMKFHKLTSVNILDLAAAIAADAVNSDSEAAQKEAMINAINSLWDAQKQQWSNPHIDLYCQLKARQNFSMSQLAVQLLHELKEEGHHVTHYVAGNDNFTAELALQKTEDKQQKAAEIASAQVIPISQAQAIKKDASAPIEDRRKAERAFLQEALPGVDLTAELIYKAVIDNRGRWLSGVRLYWRLMNPDKVKALDEKTWRNHLQRVMVYLPDIRTHSLQVEVLRELGILDLLTPGVEYCNESEGMQQLLSRALKLRQKLKVAFDLNVSAKTPPVWLWGKLLEKIGVETACVARRDNIRYYAVAENSLTDPDRIAVLEAMDRKFQNLEVTKAVTLSESNVEVCHQLPFDVYIEPQVAAVDEPVQAEPIEGDFEPDDGYHSPIRECVELLKEGINYGVEAVKAILKPWTLERRWGAVMLLERLSASALRRLEAMAPNLYEWLDDGGQLDATG